MSLFSRSLYNPDPSFTPLFRLLSDFDHYSRELQGEQDNGAKAGRGGRHTRMVTPKFDLHETKDTYELHGELPGFERENVHVEFPEPQTLTIRGHVERSYSSGTPPANLLQNGKRTKTITESGEEHGSHKTTVEDEEAAAAKEKDADGTQVVKHDKEQKQNHKAEPAEKFWVSERSFGQFERTFNFPTRINQDAVSASLQNGILNVSIPKAKKQEARRIAIN
ncbi:heat shock protein 30 [Naviculisporaceae sp. PSN 640]